MCVKKKKEIRPLSYETRIYTGPILITPVFPRNKRRTENVTYTPNFHFDVSLHARNARREHSLSVKRAVKLVNVWYNDFRKRHG